MKTLMKDHAVLMFFVLNIGLFLFQDFFKFRVGAADQDKEDRRHNFANKEVVEARFKLLDERLKRIEDLLVEINRK